MRILNEIKKNELEIIKDISATIYLADLQLKNTCVTNKEYKEFKRKLLDLVNIINKSTI